jgi:hypothetical protein
MGVMNRAIEDGIRDAGIADVVMVVFGGKVTGQDGEVGAVVVFDYLQKIPSIRGLLTN